MKSFGTEIKEFMERSDDFGDGAKNHRFHKINDDFLLRPQNHHPKILKEERNEKKWKNAKSKTCIILTKQ